jgi:hypothetical protein
MEYARRKQKEFHEIHVEVRKEESAGLRILVNAKKDGQDHIVLFVLHLTR